MGMLIDGKWQTNISFATDKQGNFIRAKSTFRDWIKKDGTSQFVPAANRYHLYVSYACPWASRTLIFRKLKGLEDCISFSIVEAFMGDNGWQFATAGEAQDPLFQQQFLFQIYTKADINFTGRVTVPVLWDKQNHTIVNNESADIIRMLNSEFNDYASNQYDYYPKENQTAIDQINKFVYDNVNNGVYRCGFADTQSAL